MARPSRGLIAIAGVLLIAALSWIPLTTEPARGVPVTVEAALTLATTPAPFRQLDRLDPGVAFLPPATLAAVYALHTRLRSDAPDLFALRTAVAAGERGPVHTARRVWLALVLGAAWSVGVAISHWVPNGTRGWASVALAAGAVCGTPLVARGILDVSASVPSLFLASLALGFLRPPGPPDAPWRAIAGGVCLGGAVAAAPAGFATLPLALLAAVGRPRADGAVRLAVVAFAAVVGAVAADLRLLESGDLLWRRVSGGGWLAPALGQPWVGSTLGALVTWPLLLLALAGLVAYGRRSETRVAAFALLLVPAVVLALPGARPDTLLPVLPALACLGAGGVTLLMARPTFRRFESVIAAGLLVSIALPSVAFVRDRSRPRNADVAAEWLLRSAPTNARVVTTFSGPELPPVATSFLLPFDVRDPETFHGAYDPTWYAAFDTFILTSDLEARFASDPERHAAPLAFFRHVESRFQRLARFDEGRGPAVEVYVRHAPAAPESVVSRAARVPPDPARADFYVSLGAAYNRAGERDVAQALYEAALAVDPGDPRALVNLSAVLLARDEVSSADALLRPRIRTHATNPHVRYQFGLVKYALGLLGEAIGEYKMAIRYDPAFVDAHFNLGICYFEAGNVGGARRSFRRVTELAPPGTHAYEEAARMVREIDAL